MKMRCTLLFVGWLLSCGAVANGQAQVELVTRLGYGYGTYLETRNATTIELAPDIRFQLNETLQTRLSARVRGDQRDFLIPGEPDVSNYDNATRPHAINDKWLVELRDAYVDIRVDQGTVRLGKQQLVWGALDGIKVLDVLNPQSFEHFILEDFDESRIGLWSVYTDLSAASWRIELALIPDVTTHYVPEPGAWFEFAAPRYRFGQSDPGISLPVIASDPEDKRGTAALRLSRYVGGVGIQFVATSGLEFEPLGRLTVSAGEPVVETYHERRNLYGFGMEGSFASFALRGEVAYSPKRVFNTRSGNLLTDEALEHWRGGIGLDWNAPLGLFVNLQYVHDHVVAAPKTLIRPDDDQIVTAFVRRRFFYDTLDLEVRWYSSLEEQDRLFRVMLGYQISDHTRVNFALDDFKGNTRGIFGQFDQRDQITLSLEHTF